MTAIIAFQGGETAGSVLYGSAVSTTASYLSSISDTKQFTISFWVKFSNSNSGVFVDNVVSRISEGDAASQSIYARLVGNGTATARHISFNIKNASNTTVLAGNTASSGADMSNSNWHHVAFSCDLSDVNKRKLIIDDVEVIPTYSTYVDDTMDHSRAYYILGASGTSVTCELAHLMYDNTYIDVVANKRNFITVDGTPAATPGDGSGFTGSQPLVYHQGSPLVFLKNKGSVNGSLTESGGTLADGTEPAL